MLHLFELLERKFAMCSFKQTVKHAVISLTLPHMLSSYVDALTEIPNENGSPLFPHLFPIHSSCFHHTLSPKKSSGGFKTRLEFMCKCYCTEFFSLRCSLTVILLFAALRRFGRSFSDSASLSLDLQRTSGAIWPGDCEGARLRRCKNKHITGIEVRNAFLHNTYTSIDLLPYGGTRTRHYCQITIRARVAEITSKIF